MRYFIAIAVLFFGITEATSSEVLKLTTLNWPPYVLEDGRGPNTDTVRAVFARAGVQTKIEVFPWNRAIKLAAEDPAWIGVYPEYYSEDIDADKEGDRCLFSKSFGISPVGFLKRKDSNFDWSSHEDLNAYVIGVVRGYVNESRLDQMIDSGEIPAELAESDTENILKVAARRTDAIVIDKLVFDYLAENVPAVGEVAGALEFHDRLLAEHGLHVCFENSAAGKAAREIFDLHLQDDGMRGHSGTPDNGSANAAAPGG